MREFYDNISRDGRGSFHESVRRRYQYLKGIVWPRFSGVTAHISEQEVSWAIGEHKIMAAKGVEISRVIADRLTIWWNGATQPEAAKYLGLTERQIKELDQLVTRMHGPMSKRPYSSDAVEDRERAYRPGVASAILRRRLSTLAKLR